MFEEVVNIQGIINVEFCSVESHFIKSRFKVSVEHHLHCTCWCNYHQAVALKLASPSLLHGDPLFSDKIQCRQVSKLAGTILLSYQVQDVVPN